MRQLQESDTLPSLTVVGFWKWSDELAGLEEHHHPNPGTQGAGGMWGIGFRDLGFGLRGWGSGGLGSGVYTWKDLAQRPNP